MVGKIHARRESRKPPGKKFGTTTYKKGGAAKKAKGGKVDVNKEVREDYQVLSDDVMKNIGKRKIAGKKVYNPRTGKELKSTRDYMVFWDEQDRVKRSMMKDKRYIPEKAKGGEVKATDRQKTSNLYQGSMGDVKDRMKRNPSFAKGMEKYYGIKADDIKYKSIKDAKKDLKKRVEKKQMGGQVAGGYNPTSPIPAKLPFRQGMRMMGHGGQTSVSNDKAGAGDIHTTHSHSGYKAGE